MIITQIIGGIGNQMFQYAAGRALALHHQTGLKLDIAHFKHYRPRTFSLDAFHIQAQPASQLEIARLDWSATTGIWYRCFSVWQKICPYHPRAAFRQLAGERAYNPAIWNTPRNVYLNGYFQSEKYFAAIAAQLRQDFTFRTALQGANAQMAQQIQATPAVSLHVRRGDYVSNPQVNQTLGTCDLEYYARGIAAIEQRIANPHFYVFSDDPAWAIQNLRLEHAATFVTHNGAQDAHEDLRLMSLCRAHILANSSFSWWGAWLDARPDKIVVAPAAWFRDPSRDAQDIIPAAWIKL